MPLRATHRLLFALPWLLGAGLAEAAVPDTPPAGAPPVTSTPTAASAPARVLVTVVSTEAPPSTLEPRVSSWFTDGTQVTVSLAREVTPELLLATTPGEVRVCVVPRGAKRALVTFATKEADASRHLLRDVHLHDGFDEIGLERLASVIHSACLALREGVEGGERADAERELVNAGLLQESAKLPAAAVATTGPAHLDARPARQKSPRIGWLFGAEYGARARGGEGLGHGPGAMLGVQLPSARGTLDILLRAQVLLRSAFDAGPLAVTLQTTALRAELGIEPELGNGIFLQALLGGGVDIARIRPSRRELVDGSQLSIATREPGSQTRGAGEVAVGISKRTPRIDFGVFVRCSFLLGDVHYTVTHSSGDERLVTPWPVQPALALQARFWGPL
jgi:hypothetical protein